MFNVNTGKVEESSGYQVEDKSPPGATLEEAVKILEEVVIKVEELAARFEACRNVLVGSEPKPTGEAKVGSKPEAISSRINSVSSRICVAVDSCNYNLNAI